MLCLCSNHLCVSPSFPSPTSNFSTTNTSAQNRNAAASKEAIESSDVRKMILEMQDGSSDITVSGLRHRNEDSELSHQGLSLSVLLLVCTFLFLHNL